MIGNDFNSTSAPENAEQEAASILRGSILVKKLPSWFEDFDVKLVATFFAG